MKKQEQERERSGRAEGRPLPICAGAFPEWLTRPTSSSSAVRRRVGAPRRVDLASSNGPEIGTPHCRQRLGRPAGRVALMETEAVYHLEPGVSCHRQDERAPGDADVASGRRQRRVAGRCDWLGELAAGFGAHSLGKSLGRDHMGRVFIIRWILSWLCHRA